MHHHTAIIDPKAKIDEGVQIGPYSIIGADVELGSGTVIESIKGPPSSSPDFSPATIAIFI